MIKVAIMGAPSTGKTTLAKELSIHLLYRRNKLAEYIDEYARQFVARFGTPTIFDQYYFFEQQLKKESAVSEKTEYLITDSPFYLSYIYGSKVLKRECEKNASTFMPWSKDCWNTSTITPMSSIYLSRKNGCRQMGCASYHIFDLQDIDDRIRGFFSIYNIHHHTVSGTLEESIDQCCKLIGLD